MTSGGMRNRLFEWIMTLALVGNGVMMVLWPDAIERGLFMYMTDLFPAECWAAMYFIFGILRGMALWANGKWPETGPRLRLIGAGGGAIIWAQMATSSILAAPIMHGAPSISIPTYLALIVGELYSVYRAARAYQ